MGGGQGLPAAGTLPREVRTVCVIATLHWHEGGGGDKEVRREDGDDFAKGVPPGSRTGTAPTRWQAAVRFKFH